MKAILLFVLLVSCIQLFAQEPVRDRDYYLLKSKRQKSGGRALLIVGTVAIAGRVLIGNSNSSSFSDAAVGVVIGGLGVCALVGSVPLFIASGRNKRKGMEMTFDIRQLPKPLRQSVGYSAIPSLTLKIPLR